MLNQTQAEYGRVEKMAWLCLLSGEEDAARRLLENNKSHMKLDELKNIIIPLKQSDILRGYRADSECSHYGHKPAFWDNFPIITRALELGGEPVSTHFLKKQVNNRSSLLECLERNANLDIIFNAKCWVNNEKELISVHSSLSAAKQMSISLKRVLSQVAHLKNEPYRPDILNMVLKRVDRNMLQIIENGELELYEEAILACGLEPHPDDIMLPFTLNTATNLGYDPNFRTINAYKNFPRWVALFKKYGHEIDVKDLVREYGQKKSLVNSASLNEIAYILDANNWRGRAEDLSFLHDHIEPKTPIDDFELLFWKNYNLVEKDQYTLPFEIDENLTKEMLLSPIKNDQGYETECYPLGLIEVWEQFDQIQEILTQKGEPITLKDLYAPISASDETALMRCASYGYLYIALGLVDPENNIYLEPRACTYKSKSEKTLIEYLEDSSQLNELLDENLWVYNPKGLQEMWKVIPQGDEKSIITDLERRMSRLNRISLLKAKQRQKAKQQARKKSPSPQ